MTQEELQKLYVDLKKMLEQGYVRNSVLKDNFRKARSEGLLDSVLTEIFEIKKDNSLTFGLANDMLANTQLINTIIDNNNVNNSKIKNLLEDLSGCFDSVKEYNAILKNINNNNKFIVEYENEKNELLNKQIKVNLSHNGLNGDIENVILDEEIAVKDNGINVCRKEIKEYQQKLEETLKTVIDIKVKYIEFQKKILSIINELDKEHNQLQLNPNEQKKLGDIIRDSRDKVVKFTVDVSSEENKIMDLENEAGLIKTNATKEEIDNELKAIDEQIKKLANDVENVKEENRIDNIINNVDETYEQSATKDEEKAEVLQESEIRTVSDLVNELKKLNPELEVSKNEYDQPLINIENPESIKLPKGFNYDESLGINNKINDSLPYLNVEVNQLKKEKNDELSNGNSEPEVIESKPEEQTKIDTSSKVKSGKQKVKKTRHAIIAPYVKAALTFGVMGSGIALLAGAAPILATGVVTAGITTVLQKCYTKACDAGLVKIPQFRNTVYEKNPEEFMAPVAIGYMISNKAKDLLSGIKEYKYQKQYGNINEETLEQIEEKPEQVEEMAPALESQVSESVASSEVQPTLSEVEARRIQAETAKDLFNRTLSSQVDQELDNLSMGGR